MKVAPSPSLKMGSFYNCIHGSKDLFFLFSTFSTKMPFFVVSISSNLGDGDFPGGGAFLKTL